MEKVEVILQFQNLKKAFSRLKEAVNVAETDLEKDGVIQRFEFTFELFLSTAELNATLQKTA